MNAWACINAAFPRIRVETGRLWWPLCSIWQVGFHKKQERDINCRQIAANRALIAGYLTNKQARAPVCRLLFPERPSFLFARSRRTRAETMEDCQQKPGMAADDTKAPAGQSPSPLLTVDNAAFIASSIPRLSRLRLLRPPRWPHVSIPRMSVRACANPHTSIRPQPHPAKPEATRPLLQV